jgi:hypothetical protein
MQHDWKFRPSVEAGRGFALISVGCNGYGGIPKRSRSPISSMLAGPATGSPLLFWTGSVAKEVRDWHQHQELVS